MKHLILYAVFFLLIIGCKKSSLPDSASQSLASSGNGDTISIAEGVGWSFQINGGTAVYGNTNECQMAKSVPDSPYQLVMDGIEDGTLGIYSLLIQLEMPSNVPVVGQYIALTAGNYNQIQIAYLYAQGSYTYYLSDSMTFNVVSYNPSTGAVSATFYGNVNDGFGNISTITNGTITGIIQQ
jgi:hypothetical protein